MRLGWMPYGGALRPPDPPSVTALDLRTTQVLWSVLVPQIPCTDLVQAASLLAYDNGFAVRTSTGQPR